MATPALIDFIKRSKLLLFFVTFLIIGYTVYFLIYFYPITNNAFVITNYRPVASQVSGYINHIYVKNGQKVKQGQLLFSIDDTLYKNNVGILKNQLLAEKKQLAELKQEVITLDSELKAIQDVLPLAKKNSNVVISLAEPRVIATLIKDKYTTNFHEISSKFKEILGDIKEKKIEIDRQGYLIQKTNYQLKNSKYYLSETKIYAMSGGVISNLFLSVGTSVTALEPLFSFIDTSEWWVQANFKETDIPAGIKSGDKATIRLKMYLGEKVFHGTVTSIDWAVFRQHVNKESRMQTVPSENQWVLLPQRFPVLIKITDPDPKFPLNVGASAYVILESQ